MQNQTKYKNIVIVSVIIIIVGIICYYQTRKAGFHEDEIYNLTSSVNPYDGLISPYRDKDVHTIILERHINDKNFIVELKNTIQYVLNPDMYAEERAELDSTAKPIWKTREDITKSVTLTPENYFNLKALYYNQAKDSHPPLYYTFVHFATLFFGGQFSKYSAFIVNIIAFIISCFVIKKILKILDKENLSVGTLIFYGLSMGTISMVIYQRMYMLLTMFILWYFYYCIKLYKNNFKFTKRDIVKLGIITILGFLTQYYFAIYAFLILFIMIIKMVKDKQYKTIFKYIGIHALYAIIGIIIFIPCINHLLSGDRGLANLGNTEYFKHLLEYVKHLLFAFTINDNKILIITILVAFFSGIVYSIKKSKEKFIMALTIIPSLVYFFLVIKLTSFREFRYITPMMPFIALTFVFILDNILSFKYKNIVIVAITTILVATGFIFSKPKFLFEEYSESLKIAEANRNKSFIFVYDNIFNHIQSIPEMMTYEKTMIINANNNELQYVINNNQLNSEDSYILCIKEYMNNEEIIEQILNNTEFKYITKLYEASESNSEVISNNLYLVSK